MLNILVIDDEANIRKTLALWLKSHGRQVCQAGDVQAARAESRARMFEMAFLDLRLGADNGLELIPKLLADSPWMKIVVMTAYSSIDTAVQAMRLGAFDYIAKPFNPEQIELVVGRVEATLAMQNRIDCLKADLQSLHPEAVFSSANPKMQRTLEMARQVADSEAVVLLRGESGTGKTMLARAIHNWSRRAEFPLGIISCPTLTPELLSSELFGHMKGAFTGAVASRRGLLEEARGGTVVLDEVGEISPAMQLKLLHAVQEKEVRPVGSNRAVRIDARFICATNRNLRQCVAEGSFRKDLYFRLAVIPVTLPPLRERGEDLILFIGHFVRKYNGTYGRNIAGVSPAAMRILMTRRWDGNIRELENVMERAVLLTETDVITPASLGDLAECPATGDSGTATRSLPEGAAPERDVQPRAVPLQDAVREAERKAIALALTLSGGSRKEAALLLGIGRRTLYHKLEEYGMELPPRKEGV